MNMEKKIALYLL